MRCPHCRQFMPRGPINAGKPWHRYLDARLRSYAASYRINDVPVHDAIPMLAKAFGRTHASIYSRLIKLDLITP